MKIRDSGSVDEYTQDSIPPEWDRKFIIIQTFMPIAYYYVPTVRQYRPFPLPLLHNCEITH